MAIRLADTARPNNHVDAEHLGTFPVAYAEDVWFEDGTRLSEKTFDGQSIQKEELPLASADELGNIYQYVGETGTYTNGHFYKCILNSSVYSWSEIKMVEKPVVYSETVPDINAYETGSIVCYTGEDSGSFEKGHLYQKNETSFTYYYWTFYRDPAKTQPYVFYTREATLANGVNVYKANPTTGEGNISLVGSISNYQEWSFFVNGSSTVQYFHPEADTSKNRTITEGDWVDIGGGSKLDNVFLVKDSEGATTLAVSQRTFTGTQAEWDALTTAEKKTYGQALITNDTDTGEVVNGVTDGDMRAVTSNAVYDALMNTTVIQSNVKRSITQSPTLSTWYSANLPKPTIPTGKRLVRWLAFTDSAVMAASVCGYNGDVDNCILVIGDIMHEDTPLTFNIWWGAEIADC